MDKKEISTVLQEEALLLELKAKNPFKVKAYSNAARSIKILEEDPEEMIRQGRLLLAREPYAIDMIRLIDEASRSGVVIELNAHPSRLDIDWRLCKYAKEKGVKIAINPDAHDRGGLTDTYFGVGIARKGWLEPADILNILDLEEMKKFLKREKPA